MQCASKGARVVMHHFGRARDVPDPSPFPVKLETWLRINKVKYILDDQFVSLVFLNRTADIFSTLLFSDISPTKYTITFNDLIQVSQ